MIKKKYFVQLFLLLISIGRSKIAKGLTEEKTFEEKKGVIAQLSFRLLKC